MNIKIQENEITFSILMTLYYILSSIFLLILISIYIYFSLQNQVSEYENLFVKKLKSVIKLHSNELLNEIALDDKDSIIQHLSLIRNDFQLDSIRLSSDKGLDVLSRDGNLKINNKLIYICKKLNINTSSSIKFGENFVDQNFRLLISYRNNILNNAIKPYVKNTLSIAVLIILLFGIVMFIIFKSIKVLVLSPLNKILKYNKVDDEPKIKGYIQIKEIVELSNSFQEIQHLKVQAVIGQIAQLFAHDVRKPFSQLRLILNALEESKYIDLCSAKHKVEKALAYVNSMINDILDYSREMELSIEPYSLYRIFDYVIRQSLQDYPENNILFDYKFSAKYMPLVDEERIIRVFNNIIGNAVEAITMDNEHQQGTITITSQDVIYDNKNMIEITIGNDGPPFKSDTIDKLFDSFYTHGKKKGTGLGLASAQKIIHLHKGNITARNRVNEKGVEFIISIMSSKKREISTSISLPKHINTNFIPLQNGSNTNQFIKHINLQKDIYRIILLEDEVLYRAGIKNIINESPRLSEKIVLYDATVVDDALALIENVDIQYAIVDIDLNDTANGYDFLAIVKEKYPTLVCLVHSNRVTEEEKQKAFDLGAKYFVPKPMNIDHLVSFISGASAPAPDPDNEVLVEDKTKVNILIIDDETFILDMLYESVKARFKKNGKPVHILTAHTYRQALERLNDHHHELKYVLCDLNIDTSRDGLLLAEKTYELNKNKKQKIEFYILTHSSIEKLAKTVCQSRVKRFYQHPLPLSVLGTIFHNEFDSDEEKHPSNHICTTANIDTNDEIIKCRTEAPVSVVETYSLPRLVKAANPEILKKTCSIIGHSVVGELDMIRYDIVNDLEGEQETMEFVRDLPFTLSEISEKLRSFLDIAKYNEMDKLKYLFIVPFNLKYFVDQFISKQQTDFKYQLANIEIVNKITDANIEVIGDEAILHKVVWKVFLNILGLYINHNNNGDIVFSTSVNEEMQILHMTCDTIINSISQDFINNLFYNTPYASNCFNLDYTACGYLMSLHNGHISVKINQAQKTTSYSFALERETCN